MGSVDIKGYEGLYVLVDQNSVISLSRTVIRGNHKIAVSKRILAVSSDKTGYLFVRLSKSGVSTKKYLHRLIAEAFIPNPENKPCVNHINGNKRDNRIENLEWCTYAENNAHVYRKGLNKSGIDHHFFGKTAERCINSKKVIDESTGMIYPSITEAAKQLGLSRTYLTSMIKGSIKNTTKLKLF